jgi:hypothetical protein
MMSKEKILHTMRLCSIVIALYNIATVILVTFTHKINGSLGSFLSITALVLLLLVVIPFIFMNSRAKKSLEVK